ncbi:pyrroloquinoline quinone biosynthesis protein PqqB [Mesorhizobium sp. M0830]|uniref:pyrroloquinoline quinone biosynthesis protein PqqB n=1 Tax=unclassified Mesorhizobium TaxID=325217 RepID=UPI0003CF858A|nr:pyrroloquinoline quinone biosynthesis protein PqqB [Mesorhizobium sp. LNHC252B00]ESY73883.1 pyrroloquinoline quinone biosynthesis protein PqqB [Mesorhizobium sp. LNHC252B00]
MWIRIIGSAAGGGFPQWNANDRLNRAARAGAPGVRSRLQTSVAASSDGRRWILFNASPDIRQQIADNTELQPHSNMSARATPMAAVVVTGAEVDQIAGLLSLRERQSFALYATEQVLAVIASNSIFDVLDARIVSRRRLPAEGVVDLRDAGGAEIGVRIEVFPVPGKVALFLEDNGRHELRHADGGTIGVRLMEGSRSLLFVPGCTAVDERLQQRIAGADMLLLDGTVFTNDELITGGVGVKTGARMGHIAMSGPDGAIARLKDIPVGRRIFIHINNTNPVLDETSPEHLAVRAAGWEIAQDRMELVL